MVDLGDNPESDFAPAKQLPWGLIAGVSAFIVLGALALWVTRAKESDQVRQTVLSNLDKELSADQSAMQTQRELLVKLTREVETLRSEIQLGQVKDGKAAVAQFKELANQQRAAREKFAVMAEAYNKKVAEYRKLEQ